MWSDASMNILQLKFEVYLASLLTLRTDLLSSCLVDFVSKLCFVELQL